MKWKQYLKGTELILPERFNSTLNCSEYNLTKLVLPERFNSTLNCSEYNLTKLVLPKEFNIFSKSLYITKQSSFLKLSFNKQQQKSIVSLLKIPMVNFGTR